jgi:hypothetical protein
LTLAAYLLATASAWSGPARAGVPPTVPLAELARDIAAVADGELSPWERDEKAARAEMAIVVLSIAFHESRFRAYVEGASCIRSPWVSFGDCDGDHAFSLWQIHEQCWWFGGARCERVTRAELSDRKAAARLAWRRAAWSISSGRALCGFTGEPGPCPKGEQRLGFARRWSAAHPFVP